MKMICITINRPQLSCRGDRLAGACGLLGFLIVGRCFKETAGFNGGALPARIAPQHFERNLAQGNVGSQ